ncbi:hypothetical protein M8494_22575 [Serratia ureilytica]
MVTVCCRYRLFPLEVAAAAACTGPGAAAVPPRSGWDQHLSVNLLRTLGLLGRSLGWLWTEDAKPGV